MEREFSIAPMKRLINCLVGDRLKRRSLPLSLLDEGSREISPVAAYPQAQ
ncbi:hypothetical protein [Oscillatoria sp. HE19RPO]|nr:hypothetical protein [Oscillatoria sp. HE19RPO]